ncbi:MAG: DEAD/DEAH box helicase [Myxococcaceae bacterium]|nr:DEAD/DEAH box helicase [Myxococcaceae bacterium]
MNHTPHGFDGLGLSASTLQALTAVGFTAPTPIQQKAIPPALAGKDVIGCAGTGTGKTAAFALPMIERLAGKPGTRGLVLAPTRELALQIAEQFDNFSKGKQLSLAVLIGGVSMGAQLRALKEGAQVIVATPGRLIDHLDQRSARLDGIEVLVLDEADRMLDMGFKPQLDRIMAKLPRQRQSLLFSATMAGEVAAFARSNLHHPEKVEVARSGTTAARADQKVYLVGQHEKSPLLLSLLREDEASTLVFTRTKRRADKVAKQLEKARFTVARIHADRSQSQRNQALDGFKTGRFRVLVATDIAARGIDVAEIGHVVIYDLPFVPEDYVHRVGRTARAAASGRASTFCSPEEKPLLLAIEKLVRTELPRAQVPREDPEFQAAVASSKAATPQSHKDRMPRSAHGGGHQHQQRHGGGGGQRHGGGGQRPPLRDVRPPFASPPPHREDGHHQNTEWRPERPPPAPRPPRVGDGAAPMGGRPGEPGRTVFRGGPKRRR